MKDGSIPDSSITVSSNSGSKRYSRLDHGSHGWYPNSNNPGHEWIMTDLGKVRPVTGVVTKDANCVKGRKAMAWAYIHLANTDSPRTRIRTVNIYHYIELKWGKSEQNYGLTLTWYTHCRGTVYLISDWGKVRALHDHFMSMLIHTYYFLFKVFQANSDRSTKVVNRFPKPVKTRFVRIYPMAYHNGMYIRFDVIDC
uniref:lactadherin-like n=1 Tax=Styela clava TaxID=7725 RepID=UPI00193A1BCA|nr:lactadherin-like [Styela clava]